MARSRWHAAVIAAFVAIACTPCCMGLSTVNDNIVDANGNIVKLMGANWFGFNNNDTMVNGLWTSSNALSYDFATVIYRWQLLGFNAIRLPFSMQDLYNLQPTSRLSSCTLPTFQQIAYSVTAPADNVDSNLAFPQPVAWAPHAPGMCNDYLPSDTTLNRFVWVVQYLARNGFYVIIDDHTEDNTILNDFPGFVTKYVDIVQRISQDPTAKQRLLVDILNEPDARGLGWNNMTSIYLGVMDAVYQVNPQVLFLVEGSGQGGLNQASWGDGFQTNNVIPNSKDDPNPFFQALFSKPYLNNVAVSPHVYGPTVTGATTAYQGTALFQRLSASFGYLTTLGYTYNGLTKKFPVVIGEVGSRFAPADVQFLADFQSYLLNSGAGADGKHNAIPNVIFWCWNANSADTGGLVDDQWTTLLWYKTRWLDNLGLTPWYKAAAFTPRLPMYPPPPPSAGSMAQLSPLMVILLVVCSLGSIFVMV